MKLPYQGHGNGKTRKHRSLCDVFEPIKIITFKLFPQKSSLLLANCFCMATSFELQTHIHTAPHRIASHHTVEATDVYNQSYRSMNFLLRRKTRQKSSDTFLFILRKLSLKFVEFRCVFFWFMCDLCLEVECLGAIVSLCYSLNVLCSVQQSSRL